MNLGSSNRTNNDVCAYEKRLYESTSPLAYRLYFGAQENCSKCVYDKFYRKYDLVDVESELRNQNRPLSQCDQFKYNPSCPKNRYCMSTFDKSAPISYPPEVCPIVYNNIPKRTDVGYRLPSANICRK